MYKLLAGRYQEYSIIGKELVSVLFSRTGSEQRCREWSPSECPSERAWLCNHSFPRLGRPGLQIPGNLQSNQPLANRSTQLPPWSREWPPIHPWRAFALL